MSSNTKMRIRLYSFDSTVLENAVRRLIQVILKSGGQVVGPVPLKTKKKELVYPDLRLFIPSIEILLSAELTSA